MHQKLLIFIHSISATVDVNSSCDFPMCDEKSLFNFIGLVIAILAIALSIFGCNYLLFTPPANITTIKLSGWSAFPAEQRLLKGVVHDFEVQHPNIKIKYMKSLRINTWT
jgi:hypothetical protein